MKLHYRTLSDLIDAYRLTVSDTLDLEELEPHFEAWANLTEDIDEDGDPALLIGRSRKEVEHWLDMEAQTMTQEEFDAEFGVKKIKISEAAMLSRWPKIPTNIISAVLEKARSLKDKVEDPLEAALTATIRHEFTDYDELLCSMEQEEARATVVEKVRNIRRTFAGVTSEAGG